MTEAEIEQHKKECLAEFICKQFPRAKRQELADKFAKAYPDIYDLIKQKWRALKWQTM